MGVEADGQAIINPGYVQMTEKFDPVNKPKHYCMSPSGIECIQITEHMSFTLGNVIKYTWRADEKHDSPLEDLKKARWYLDREIAKYDSEK